MNSERKKYKNWTSSKLRSFVLEVTPNTCLNCMILVCSASVLKNLSVCIFGCTESRSNIKHNEVNALMEDHRSSSTEDEETEKTEEGFCLWGCGKGNEATLNYEQCLKNIIFFDSSYFLFSQFIVMRERKLIIINGLMEMLYPVNIRE